MSLALLFSFFFFFNDTATTEIYTLSLHDALPICLDRQPATLGQSVTSVHREVDDHLLELAGVGANVPQAGVQHGGEDRKSTRLNSSHSQISYAVFCLKKKNKNKKNRYTTRTATEQ